MPTRPGRASSRPILSDEAITLSRYRFGHDHSFDRAAGWLYDGMSKAFAANTARLAIVGDDPMLLSSEDPGQGRARQQGQFHRLQAGAGADRYLRHQLEHRRLSEPVMGELVFPEDEEDVAVAKLADAIFAASRVDNDDSDRGVGRSTMRHCAAGPNG